MFHVKSLEEYVNLVLKWNSKINLISKNDVAVIFSRHIDDSAQLFSLIDDKNAVIADLGSGNGLPGVVLNIKGCANVHLIEIDERKSVFLREVKRQLGLSCLVINADVSQVEEKYDICVSRGLGSLQLLLGFALRLLKRDGYCLFLKGQTADKEIAESLKYFSFEVQKYPSITDKNGVILRIKNIKLKLDG